MLWCPNRAHVTRETCRETKAKDVAAKPEGKRKNASRAGACARHPRSFRLEALCTLGSDASQLVV